MFMLHMCQFCHRKIAKCNIQFQSFKMFLNVWDVRQEISVVSAHVNLNGLMVHMKNRKMENRSAPWFGLTYLNKTMGKMCDRKNSKRYIADEILLLSLNMQYF